MFAGVIAEIVSLAEDRSSLPEFIGVALRKNQGLARSGACPGNPFLISRKRVVAPEPAERIGEDRSAMVAIMGAGSVDEFHVVVSEQEG